MGLTDHHRGPDDGAPRLGGRWLDERRGTNYWALIGLVLGLIVGLWQLLQIAGRQAAKTTSTPRNKKSSLQKPSSSSDSIDA